MLLTELLLLLTCAVATVHSFPCYYSSEISCDSRQPGKSYRIACKGENFVLGLFTLKEYRLSRGKVLTTMCIKVGPVYNCTSSGSLNNIGKDFEFNCPAGKAITDIAYTYNGGQGDGNYEFECCNIRGKTPTSCVRWNEESRILQLSRMANHALPDAKKPAITGIYSTIVNRDLQIGEKIIYKTRVYEINICDV